MKDEGGRMNDEGRRWRSPLGAQASRLPLLQAVVK